MSAGGYRLIVALLALGYFADTARLADYHAFGAQFRFLTIWGQTANLVAALLMLVPRFGRPDGRLDTLLSVIAIVGALVVFSYWRLYLIDPHLVNGDDTPKPYRDYYLHLVGPALMWIDLLVLKRGFRRILPAIAGLAVMVVAYVGWIELLVAPRNSEPVGKVSTGFPYPFLNDMTPDQRGTFYGAIFVTGIAFILLFRLLSAVLRRLRG